MILRSDITYLEAKVELLTGKSLREIMEEKIEEGENIRGIADYLGVCSKTVRKYLKKYNLQTAKPKIYRAYVWEHLRYK